MSAKTDKRQPVIKEKLEINEEEALALSLGFKKAKEHTLQKEIFSEVQGWGEELDIEIELDDEIKEPKNEIGIRASLNSDISLGIRSRADEEPFDLYLSKMI